MATPKIWSPRDVAATSLFVVCDPWWDQLAYSFPCYAPWIFQGRYIFGILPVSSGHDRMAPASTLVEYVPHPPYPIYKRFTNSYAKLENFINMGVEVRPIQFEWSGLSLRTCRAAQARCEVTC